MFVSYCDITDVDHLFSDRDHILLQANKLIYLYAA